MADIAQIGFKADTSQLADAKAKLDALPPSAARVERAADKLGKALGDAGNGADKLGRAAGNVNDGMSKAAGSTNTATGLISRFAIGVLGAVLAVDKLINFIGNSIKEMAALGETSKRTGIELQRLQAIQSAGVGQGLTRSQVSTGLEGLSEALNEARHKENDLSKLFDDNNIKLKTRTGEIMSTNEALLQASNLIRNAATEFDKIKIAEALGLTKEWIPFLEQGREEIEKQVGAAEAAGGAFDKEMVKRASDFQNEWASAIDKWRMFFMQAAIVIMNAIEGLISAAGRLWGVVSGVANYIQGSRARYDIENNGVSGASGESIRVLRDRMKAEGVEPNAELKSRFDALDVEELYSVPFEIAKQNKALEVTVNKGGGKKTNVSSLFPEKGGGGGSSGKSDEDKFEDIVTRADARIAKLQAERDALSMTAEAAAKLKYETDLLNQANRAGIELTDAQRTKLTELAAQMAKTETETKALKSALDFGADLTKGFLSDFIDGIKNGQSVFESFGKAAMNVLNKIGDKLISMAVDSLFKGGGGGSGLFGSLFGFIGKLFGGGSALGNVFDSGLQRYAKGGSFTNSIVSQPTLFSYAQGGKFGEMGEAGPEAIMPLSRGPDGSLGVEMHGSAPGSVVNIEAPVTNIYRIEGAISEESVTARIRASAEETAKQMRKQIVPLLNEYSSNGAIV